MKKTADGIEIVKGMAVWVSPFFEADDGAIKFGKLKTYMDDYIVSSIDNLNSRVKLKREGLIAFRAVFSIENIYANKNKAIEKRIDVLREIISEKRDILNEEIDAIQDLKNDLDEQIK